jgi:alpha-D-ribose 1-methylphosphonate 5-triphosphate synthase subunit PhnG
MDTLTNDQKQRKHWMSALSQALPEEVEQAWEETQNKPGYAFLRMPQMGLAMVRGTTGAGGEAFNLGEITMTRASVRLDSGKIGHGYVAGRRPRHAELCAVFDALAQEPDRKEDVLSRVVGLLERAAHKRKTARQRQTDATKVEFFTMVRGE